MTLVLVAAALAAAAARHRTTAERVLWALAAMGLACILGAEIGVVPDEFSGGQFERMNTVFKMGYQAWLLLAVFGAVALAAARAVAAARPASGVAGGRGDRDRHLAART